MGILNLTERRLGPDVLEIEVEGELDLSVAGELQEGIDRTGPETTLIDLALYGGRVVVHSPSDQVLRVLTVIGLTGEGLVFSQRKAAA